MKNIKICKRISSRGAKNLKDALNSKIFGDPLPVDGKIVDFFDGKQIEVDNKRFVVLNKTDELSVFQKKYLYGFPLCGDPEEKEVNSKESFYFLPYESAKQIWGKSLSGVSL